MSQQTRTPRQRQGDGLVPLAALVSPKLRQRIVEEARFRKCSSASVVRRALTRYFYGTA